MGGKDVNGDGVGHLGRVKLREPKGGLAKLAVFLLRVREPFHQTVLVDVFDASAAFARVEQGFVGRGLAAADPAGVRVDAGTVRRSPSR